MRIGVNALYLIPGGVGGTETYLRALLAALADIDSTNQYFVFTNRETGADLVPKQANFTHVPQSVRAKSRPMRMLWEQTMLPLAAVRLRLDVMFNPGFTAPIFCPSISAGSICPPGISSSIGARAFHASCWPIPMPPPPTCASGIDCPIRACAPYHSA